MGYSSFFLYLFLPFLFKKASFKSDWFFWVRKFKSSQIKEQNLKIVEKIAF